MLTSEILSTILRRIADELDTSERDEFAYSGLNRLWASFMSNGGLRDSYTWGAIHAAHLAKTLGYPRLSLLEFGVAGGRGLLALERVAQLLEQTWPLEIEVWGFDTGQGLPAPEDYRDLPNLWHEGQFPMNRGALEARLTKARLCVGKISDTLPKFLAGDPAPVGFMSIDVDLYSSTRDALHLLGADTRLLLPRIHCYFDDIQGFTFSEFTGERLAIEESNCKFEHRKISPIYGLRHFVPAVQAHRQWVELFYMAHIFDHPDYSKPDGLLRCQRLDI